MLGFRLDSRGAGGSRRRAPSAACRRAAARTTWRSSATCPYSDELDAAIAELRTVIREATGAAVTFGYGPRFQHSTGQLHKGGPPNGRFLQLVYGPAPRRRDPGRRLLVRHADRGPGRRRPRDAALTRAARRAGQARGRPALPRCARSPSGSLDCCRRASHGHHDKRPGRRPGGQPARRRGSSGCRFIPRRSSIFGATGDLAHRKLLPALYNLAHEGALPERFELIGVARSR